MHNKITLIVDWDDTLSDLMKGVDGTLSRKLAEVKANGADVCVCSCQKFSVIRSSLELEGECGFMLEQDAYIQDMSLSKNTIDFWQELIVKKNLDPACTIVLDDQVNNCAAAQKAGLMMLLWEYGDEQSYEDLDVVLKSKGYQP